MRFHFGCLSQLIALFGQGDPSGSGNIVIDHVPQNKWNVAFKGRKLTALWRCYPRQIHSLLHDSFEGRNEAGHGYHNPEKVRVGRFVAHDGFVIRLVTDGKAILVKLARPTLSLESAVEVHSNLGQVFLRVFESGSRGKSKVSVGSKSMDKDRGRITGLRNSKCANDGNLSFRGPDHTAVPSELAGILPECGTTNHVHVEPLQR
mmetsp:Transcript_16809/g.34563  ORF Transcript_16809/g.34563 Transcript_16809/m.34563 type:complete len:204 (+) Transcript_16809:303-914(+)